MVKTKVKDSGSVFIREDLSRAYDSETVAVDWSAGTDVLVLPPGYPMKGAVPATAAEVSIPGTVTSVVLNEVRAEAGTALVNVAVLPRGTGIVVNRSMRPLVDIAAGAAIDADDYQTELETLGFVVRLEPTEVQEQAE